MYEWVVYRRVYLFLILIGDIQIVAALGDGIIAGKGAMADNLADMTIEYKGVSFATGNTYISNVLIYSDLWMQSNVPVVFHIYFSYSILSSILIGGDNDWRKKLTIPNILKEFNSRLKGASKGKLDCF